MSKRAAVVALLAIFGVLAAGGWWWYAHTQASRKMAQAVFRIGYADSPPYHGRSADGQPTGPAVEILVEAARRKGIRLEWVFVPDSPDVAFAQDRVDLWPLVGIAPERGDLFYTTRPWRIARPWLVVHAGSPLRPAHLPSGTRIGVGWGSMVKRFVARRLPQVDVSYFPGSAESLNALCRGELDGALMQDTPGDEPAPVAPQCGGTALELRPFAGAEFGYGIGASRRTPYAAEAAERLRDEITSLSDDGTLATIYFRWFRNTSKEVHIVEQLMTARAHSTQMIWALGVITTVVLLLLLQTSRLERARNQAQLASTEAQNASRAKSEFLSRMSHELRTPLNGVIGSVELLDRTRLDREQRELTQILRKAARILLDNINSILDFSRIEAGKVELDAVAFSPVELIRDVLDVLRPETDRKRLALLVHGADALPQSVIGDPSRIRQVLLNILANAQKFTDTGSIVVSVSTCGDPQLPQRVLFRAEVSDTGPGIPADRQAALFDPFEQADASTTRRYGGTGLGLAISRRLVETMGGEIGCRSSVGVGSVFWFTVPLMLAEPETGQQEQSAAESSSQQLQQLGQIHAAPANWSHARVLLAEDNAMNRKVAARMLQQMGIVPDLAPDGEHAVRLASTMDYHLILMDCMMPKVDGFEATRQIRAFPLNPQPVIIALTANAFVEDRDQCLRAGMDDHLGKPFTFKELRAAIQRGLAPRLATSPPAQTPLQDTPVSP